MGRFRGSWIHNKAVWISLVILCTLVTIPYQISSNAKAKDEEKYSTISSEVNQRDGLIIPLIPSLSWNERTARTQMLSLDGYPEPVSAPGYYFESESFYVSEKPPRSIFDYYSPSEMNKYDWDSMGYLDKPNSIGIMYKHATENRYMTVFIEGCNYSAERQPGINSIPEHIYCVKLWFSQVIRSSSQLQKSEPPRTNHTIPYAPLSVDYDNPLPVPFYSQKLSDPNNQIVLGLGCPSVTINMYGCSLTAHAMLYNYYQPGYTSVLALNDSMKVTPGVYDCDGNCCNWWPLGTPDAPEGVSFGTRYTNDCRSVNCIDSDNVPIIDTELDSGRPLYLRVHVGTGFNAHSVVLTGHSGNNYYINDPWAQDETQLTLTTGAMGPYVVDFIDTIVGLPPGTCAGPSLQNPLDGFISSSQTVDFSWSDASGCTYSGYKFRIKDTSNMDSGGHTLEDTEEAGTSQTETIDLQWHNIDLYWGVKADNAPNGAYWSVRRFRVETPTPPHLVGFSAISALHGIQLDWQTAQEVDLLGFYLFRADELHGSLVKISPELISAINPGELRGNSYQYLDRTVEAGKAYDYWIEWVAKGGSEFYGSVTARMTLFKFWLPLSIR